MKVYRIFLADESSQVRAEIRELLAWNRESFVLAGEASDGESALSKIRDLEPDIVITGLRMPFMDGVALSRAVRYGFPWMEILLLNGHDDEVNDEAIRELQIPEVLFRPVSAHGLHSALLRIARKLEERDRSLPRILKRTHGEVSWRHHEYERLLNDWLQGKVELPEGCPEQVLLRRMLLIPAADRPHCRQLSGLLRFIEHSRVGVDRLCTFELPEGACMIASATDAAELERTVYGIAAVVRHMAPLAGMAAPQICIGGCFPTMEMLRADYRTLRRRAALAERQILGPGDAMRAVPGVPGAVIELAELLLGARSDEVGSILAEYTRDGALDGEEAACAAAEIEREVCGAARETWTPQPNFAARRDQLLLAMDIRDARMPECRTLPITRLRRLIAQSYRNPGLSLADVARQAGMAQERFSIVFQQEMGRTFIDHLSRLRIGAAARRLACTRQRISTISRSVGYNDVDYFAAVFVRIMGVDPKEYRRQNARV